MQQRAGTKVPLPKRRAAPDRITLVLWSMTDPDPTQTLREFREYFTNSYEAQHRLAARIGISHRTLIEVLADSVKPKARTIARLRAFLDAEARRNVGGNGIKPAEPVPMKIDKRTRCSLYMRLCPFCRKARGKIQAAGRNSARSAERTGRSGKASSWRAGRGVEE
jgi:transcriptional regulator with XRE-family HTH domain